MTPCCTARDGPTSFLRHDKEPTACSKTSLPTYQPTQRYSPQVTIFKLHTTLRYFQTKLELHRLFGVGDDHTTKQTRRWWQVVAANLNALPKTVTWGDTKHDTKINRCKVKGEGEVVSVHAMKAYRASGCIPPLILNLGSRCR
jgi:hypothetical protein